MGVCPEGLRLIRKSAGMGSMFSTTRGAFTTRSQPEAVHRRQTHPVRLSTQEYMPLCYFCRDMNALQGPMLEGYHT